MLTGMHSPLEFMIKTSNGHTTWGMYLVIICDAAIRSSSHNLRGGGPQVTWAHDTRLGYTQAQNQVVPPQGHVAISGPGCACLFGIHWTTARGHRKK